MGKGKLIAISVLGIGSHMDPMGLKKAPGSQRNIVNVGLKKKFLDFL